MSEKSRFVVGIDLGTTNCCVCYVDTWGKKDVIHSFRIPQLNEFGAIASDALLPSFHYLAESHEFKENFPLLPWDKRPREYVVGIWAREQGMKVPTRLVHSAKSWLSNTAANRKEKILPFEAADEKRRISPVEAVSSFLEHIRSAWNKEIARENVAFELECQEVMLTLPASFDEVARRLTMEAATLAGILNVTLLEEPQAAFYCWLKEHENCLGDFFQERDTVLVCDVGGGTTDFSLIEISRSQGAYEFQRKAVGPHLLLGGDNMDMAICHYAESLQSKEFSASEWLSLRHQARKAKETLLSEKKETSYALTVFGQGSKVIGGSVNLKLEKEEIKTLLVEGFFGLYDFENALNLKKASPIRSMGLGFEAEPSITKHLAHFIFKSGEKQKPHFVLFNGGTMKPKVFQERISKSIDSWFPEGKAIEILSTSSLDFAVAKGAAYFGMVRRGEGIRIGGGLARSYYLKINVEEDSRALAMTILARGSKENVEFVAPTHFSLMPNIPLSFQLYHSHTRLHDINGEIVEIEEEEMAPLPPLLTVLKYGKAKSTPLIVQLCCQLTELGILEVSLISVKTEHRWKLEFQLTAFDKSEIQMDNRLSDTIFDASHLENAKKEIVEAFAIGQQEKLKSLMPTLESVLQQARNDWSVSILRGLYEPLFAAHEKRNLNAAFDLRFWNLAGFFLRPGFGYPLDDYRIKELWKLILADLKKAKTEEVEIQKWISYRRISGGLKKGQQIQLFNEIFPLVYNPNRKSLILSERKAKYAFEEKLRTLASFELVELPQKIKLGEALLNRILEGKASTVEFWALGRIGSRQLFYGTMANVIDKSKVEEWVSKLLVSPSALNSEHLTFLFSLLAKRTDLREINLSPSLQDKVEAYLKEKGDTEFLTFSSDLSLKQKERLFGDSLPTGLTLLKDKNHIETIDPL